MDETTSKKNLIALPKDGVISTREDGDDDDEQQKQGNKKNRKTKPPPKTAERTLLATESTKCDKDSKDSKEEWTQNQQKIFEWGLSNFPKGTAERWEKIAEHIPGKDKVSRASCKRKMKGVF